VQVGLDVRVTGPELDDEAVVCATWITCPEGFEEPPAPLVVDKVTTVFIPELLPLPST
jgi:hypothetical protein